MKLIVSTKFCHPWTYVLMAVVIFQFVALAHSYATQSYQKYCGKELDTAIDKACLDGVDKKGQGPLSSRCCHGGGCTALDLQMFCKPHHASKKISPATPTADSVQGFRPASL